MARFSGPFFYGAGMQDDNWDLINGETAHKIEVLNYSNQVNVIEALVHFLMHHRPADDGSCAMCPPIGMLQEFHRTATLLLLAKPGQFREEEVIVSNGVVIIHRPPPFVDLPTHLKTMFEELARRWDTENPAQVGAYVLWMTNWIHPFKNGNGRTARAFCYACICLKYGFVLPGKVTLIDMIMQQRPEYQTALKQADASFEATGTPDLTLMIDFLDRLIADQINSIVDDPADSEGSEA